MKILVTGGTGLVGSHVVRQLAGAGHQLLLLSRGPERPLPEGVDSNGIETLCCDLSEIRTCREELRRFGAETAIHLAWEGIPDYGAATSTRNLQMGLDLIASLAETGCARLICTGSCWEYADKSGVLGEESPVKETNPFTAAKISLHRMGREIAAEKGMTC